MKMFAVILLSVFFFFIASSLAQGNRGLPPEAVLDAVRHGAVLAYDIDVRKCDINLPSTIPAYSYGDAMNDVYIRITNDTHWSLYSTEERPVNTSRFQIQNGGWRVTELEFSPGDSPGEGSGVITITDIEQGADGKVLATGTISCKTSSGGIAIFVQRMPEGDLDRFEDVFMALRRGEALTFSVDLSACKEQLDLDLNQGHRLARAGTVQFVQKDRADNASEVWVGRLMGYRIPQKVENAVEVTSVLMGPKVREVFNVRVQPDQAQVKVYALTRPTHEPTPVRIYDCTFGQEGSLHFHRL